MRGGPGSGRTPIAPTAFMALSLVSLAIANLVLVLAAIGLVRDARTPDIQLLREQEVRTSGHKSEPCGASSGRDVTRTANSKLLEEEIEKSKIFPKMMVF